ncbi:SHIRT domain-containing protein [Actinotignum schaalii]
MVAQISRGGGGRHSSKPIRAVLTILLAVGLIGFSTVPASADPTDVPINVGSDAYAIDNEGQITSESEFLYDSSKGDTATDAYQIAYRGTLDMTKVWQLYSFFKSVWLWRNANDQARYAAKTFSGEWDISFTVDPAVVFSNPDFVSCEAVQSEMDKQNAPSKFGEIMRCETAAYDAATGKFTAHFGLHHADGSKVTGADLDKPEYQPAKLVLTTPAHAFYVPQSKFEAGKTFSMVEPTVRGTMAMDYFYVGMPLRFNDTSDPVTLTMVATHDASFTFASRDPERQLPESVTKLVPERVTKLRDGVQVTPPALEQTSVADGQGTWTFDAWEPAEATMAGSNLNFVGYWKYAVNPDAVFNATYKYVAADGSALPDEVMATLPNSEQVTQGSTVTPPTPAQTEFTSTTRTESADVVTTWKFDGWEPTSAVVDGADLSFTGTWTKTVVETPLPPKPEPEPGPDPEPEPEPEPTTEPEPDPTCEPTVDPTVEPTDTPTTEPSPRPSTEPSQTPTVAPTPEPAPTSAPQPTVPAPVAPTTAPTISPTAAPTAKPAPVVQELSKTGQSATPFAFAAGVLMLAGVGILGLRRRSH